MKGADRRRARQPGAVVLALLVGTTATALALTLLYHLGVPGLVVTFLLGLPALYLGWVALQDARRPPDLSLAQIADELAGRLRSDWNLEAEARGLNDPYPLPVAWTVADAPLAGDLDELKTLAIRGAGWSARARKNWARGPEDLAGGGDRKLADVLPAVPTGRLVVLGEPGSGKTMLMVGLVLDLLHPARRRNGGPVPVLATLASWDPVSQDLHGWLGARLITDYPALAAAPPPGSAGSNRFEALLEAGLILPVLDGLDEIPESARPVAISRINRGLKPGERAVITCRTEQYKAAVSSRDGQGAALRAAAVQLSTLRFGEVAGYLRRDAGPAGGRWDFLDTLSAESPVRLALATPLMAGLARIIYNPRPGEHAGMLRDPAELCDFADRSAVEAHLFDAFIASAYRAPAGGRWTAKQAEAWLVFLARHLERTIALPDLAWWQLRQAVPRVIFALVTGLGGGLVAGLVVGLIGGVMSGRRSVLLGALGFCLAGGLALELVTVFDSGFRDLPKGTETPSRGMRIDVARLGLGLLIGLGVGLAAGLLEHVTGFWFVVGIAALFGFPFGAGLGLTAVPGDLAPAVSPRAVLARDRQAAFLLVLTGGLGVGLAAGLLTGLRLGLVYGLVFGPTAGLGFGLGLAWTQTAWPSYAIAWVWFALRHRLPWSLMSFLADAHRRGILRQTGAVYQFRHLDLQHRLATRP